MTLHAKSLYSDVIALAMPTTRTSAAVHEDDGAVFHEDDVGSAGELFSMQPKAEAEAIQNWVMD